MKPNIFDRMLQGGMIDHQDPEMGAVWAGVADTIARSATLNTLTSVQAIRTALSAIIGSNIDNSTIIFAPFHTNFGKHIHIGKHVFINHGCSFLDLGGITIEDHVLIGPKVSIITENHPIHPAQRKSLVLHAVVIKANAWIGAGATILPGVTVGENSIVAAGAVVTKNVAANTMVAGVPAQFIKHITD
ncbi:MAG: hypothetical protein RIT03_629 [Bacteroidota bacterium]|jgi:acetyltransferase-like isoleucine patch superfamily enzyme